MLEITISLDWTKEPDKNDAEYRIAQWSREGLEQIDTQLGLLLYRRHRSIIALKWKGEYYFKPFNPAKEQPPTYTGFSAPSKAQFVPNMVWIDIGTKPYKKWTKAKWTDQWQQFV